MLVQMYYPQSLSPARLDKYLAGGWFRSSYTLYRAQIMCLDGDISSVVNIRLKLDDYQSKKSLRRIQKRGNERFKVVIQEAIFDAEREALYQQQKTHFQGLIVDSLELFIRANLEKPIFDTHEICVYDGDKLIAVSFFDVGKNSVASILALYDRENYAKYSLGTYTMLLEIEYALKHNFKYYYLGCILERPSSFDYKLKVMGNCQYYNWKGRWKSLDKLTEEIFPTHILKEKIAHIETQLKARYIPYKKLLYPLFGVGYAVNYPEFFLKGSLCLFCFFEAGKENQLVIEYDLDQEIYILSEVSGGLDYLLNTGLSEEFSDSEKYYPRLLGYERKILSSENPTEIIDKVMKSSFSKRIQECRQIPVQTKYSTPIGSNISKTESNFTN